MAVKEKGIYFHFQVKGFTLSERTALKKFIGRQLQKAGKKIETINFIFSSDDQVLEINRSYLSHNFYTDIITFELSGKNQPLLADIYISIDRIRENADLFHSSFKQELHRVIFHGILHLIGYSDKSKPEAQAMRSLETKWLSLYFRST